jgi:TctA family transporter
MSSFTTKPLQLVRLGAVALSVLLSLLVGFMAQASSPDYQRLFLIILPLAVLDIVLIVFVWTGKERGKVLLVAVSAFLGFASCFEMACRVIFGFRLL